LLPLNKAKFGSHFISAFLLISCVALLLISACVPTFELKVTIQNQPLLTLGKIAYINGGDIWIYDLDNSQTTRLTHDGYNSQPQWSEDGERIAFINKGQLYVTNATLYQPQLIDSRPVDWFNWSPDGTYLAYFINNVGIFIWNEASQNKKIILPVFHDNNPNNFFWNNSGFITYTIGSVINGDYWVSINRVGLSGGTVETIFTTNELQGVPLLANVSADEQWITYWLWDTTVSFPEQDGLSICLLHVTDKKTYCTKSQTIPSNDFINWTFGSYVAFISTRASTNQFKNSLVVTNSTNSSESELIKFTDGQAPIHPEISLDGKLIAFSAEPELKQNTFETQKQQSEIPCNRRIWSVDINTKIMHQLTSDEEYCDDDPEWSVDGRRLLFLRVSDQYASLWLINSDGRDLHQVIPELTPKPEPIGEYGYINKTYWWDWWRPKSS